MKYFVLRNNVAAKVVALLETGARYGDKPLQLAALRFVRACVGAKDDFYNRRRGRAELLALLCPSRG